MEIKEILDNLKDEVWSKTGSDSYDKLLDYITNLQSRIEKAVKYNQQVIKDTKDFYRPTEDIIYSGDTLIDIAEHNVNILDGKE